MKKLINPLLSFPFSVVIFRMDFLVRSTQAKILQFFCCFLAILWTSIPVSILSFFFFFFGIFDVIGFLCYLSIASASSLFAIQPSPGHTVHFFFIFCPFIFLLRYFWSNSIITIIIPLSSFGCFLGCDLAFSRSWNKISQLVQKQARQSELKDSNTLFLFRFEVYFIHKRRVLFHYKTFIFM